MLPLFRSGNVSQAALLSSYISMFPVRPLCSTGVTPLLRSYGPLRLPARAVPSVIDSLGPWGARTASPPCRVSQDPRLIYSCALSPTTPEGPASACSLLPRRCQASSSLADWPPPLSVTRPNRVRLRYGSQVCLPGFHQTDCSASLQFSYMHERAIYMVNSSQFTRSARLSLVHPSRSIIHVHEFGGNKPNRKATLFHPRMTKE